MPSNSAGGGRAAVTESDGVTESHNPIGNGEQCDSDGAGTAGGAVGEDNSSGTAGGAVGEDNSSGTTVASRGTCAVSTATQSKVASSSGGVSASPSSSTTPYEALALAYLEQAVALGRDDIHCVTSPLDALAIYACY
eukprot:CAMPEP_0119304698 /NCGR_PEP_ID=MMETSP1333-20130426/5855_1 /TAXON_ID=418940 /ORGANISM="Scyphosphaera apsteinii, Strain RCC1455" /LENGTH=136 /DNA_ID=CAMNT_0007307629 /DNA_START=127 /DNA_END=538 /DNA_ORIENTATION=+